MNPDLAGHGNEIDPRWMQRTRRPRQLAAPAYLGFLLDAEPDLAEELDMQLRLVARQALTAMLIDTDPGDCDLGPWLAAAGSGPGLLLLEGTLAIDAHVGTRTATELVGPGDLLQPPPPDLDDILERRSAWHALTPARMAVLDDEFARCAHPWPQIEQALMRRASRHATDLQTLRAIASHPRLEVRIVLLLWHLAARWGRVQPGGIRLRLPLTHRLIGHLIAAERPSVSHALARLSAAGLITGCTADLQLHGSVQDQLGLLDARTPGMPQSVDVGASGRRGA